MTPSAQTMILCVDDDPLILKQLKVLLENFGYPSRGLTNAKFLFQLLNDVPIDLILMDINMPGISGLSLLKQLQTHDQYQNLPVIMLTGDVDRQLIAESFQAGAKDFVTKPIDELVLIPRLQSILEAKTYQDNLLKTMVELEKAHEAAQVSMKAKDIFISNVSHEIRTPLTIIREYAHMLLRNNRKFSDEKKNKYLESVYVAANNLSDLVDGVLDFSQLESGHLKLNLNLIEINPILESTKAHFEILSKKEKKTLIFQIPNALPKVYVDEKKLKQILFNLIGNAIKFTPPLGQITVGAVDKAPFVEIWIEDNGVGIPYEFQSKIFERFTRADNSGSIKGTGIGLTIAKQLVEAMEGKLWFESALDKGSTFYFTIPQLNHIANQEQIS